MDAISKMMNGLTWTLNAIYNVKYVADQLSTTVKLFNDIANILVDIANSINTYIANITNALTDLGLEVSKITKKSVSATKAPEKETVARIRISRVGEIQPV